jgi:hypothetical protein
VSSTLTKLQLKAVDLEQSAGRPILELLEDEGVISIAQVVSSVSIKDRLPFSSARRKSFAAQPHIRR